MKFYVGCGTLRHIISASTEMEACIRTIQMVADSVFTKDAKDLNEDYKIGPDFLINETGWGSGPTMIIDTVEVFRKAGWEIEEGEW